MPVNDYKGCMAQKMGNGALKGLTKEERKIEFCSMAKMCSKGVSHDEAVKICKAMPPKPPKPEGEVKHRRSKKAQAVEAAECPAFDPMKLVPKCEITLGKLAGNGILPKDIPIPEICQAILG